MYTDDYAEQLKARAGEAWRPSNGFELDVFMRDHCCRCTRYANKKLNWCDIITQVTCAEFGGPEYPTEIVIGTDGQPTCLSFEKRGG